MSIYDKIGAKTAGIKARTVEKTGDKTPRTAPGMFLNATQRMDAAEAKIEELEAQLKEARTQTAEIALDELHEVDGRRRKLTGQQYHELRENLRQNPLVTPITVRRRAEGGYEIVSGNNRVAAFRELGRTHIPAALLESDDDQAEINSFYANLLQPDLPDFEKYQGFRKILERRPDLTQAQIAEGAGVSRSFISQLMAFDDLPAEVLAALSDRPNLIGANAAQDLGALTKRGRADQVTQSVYRLARGEIDQSTAVREASLDPAVKVEAKAKPEPVRIKMGKKTYCALQRADRVLRIQFQTPEEAAAVQDAICEVLERRAKELKEAED
ncbi:ParB/RepB/Spo0J family partition protein [Noviherbaspirillum galbum]|uniref:ParB/RepB/Spo0J family partition protein n=1 Tax=Noviherbaspirillum galbum TaxID=2709383 RepID=A0A6B3SYG0_9BURK|nr:ParB/RepB/Spo0J family partition protein [Noviherbaspirillum galbum]NEX62999.1 ParB/RepB/Spo0J family partition protein [Noviherbaspirillum galbum]